MSAFIQAAGGGKDDDDKADQLRKEREADPEKFDEKYGVDPSEPYEPVPTPHDPDKAPRH